VSSSSRQGHEKIQKAYSRQMCKKKAGVYIRVHKKWGEDEEEKSRCCVLNGRGECMEQAMSSLSLLEMVYNGRTSQGPPLIK